MKDYILRATAGNDSVRIFAANTQDLVDQAAKLHKSTPVASVTLGRMLTAAAMMGATLKNESDIITLDIRGSGPLGGVVVVSDSKSRVKGYTFNPQVELIGTSIQLMKKPNGKLDVSGALGLGVLTVTQDMGLKEPVSGQVELISGEIAEDIAYYFTVSEQTPSSVLLGVLVDRNHSIRQAGGLIIQRLPNASDDFLTQLESKLETLPPLTTLLDEGHSIEDILNIIFAESELVVHEKIEPEFYCNCSREKSLKALASVGFKDLRAMIEEDKGANLHCHFCNADYPFSEDDLTEILRTRVSRILPLG